MSSPHNPNDIVTAAVDATAKNEFGTMREAVVISCGATGPNASRLHRFASALIDASHYVGADVAATEPLNSGLQTHAKSPDARIGFSWRP